MSNNVSVFRLAMAMMAAAAFILLSSFVLSTSGNIDARGASMLLIDVGWLLLFFGAGIALLQKPSKQKASEGAGAKLLRRPARFLGWVLIGMASLSLFGRITRAIRG